MQEIPYKLMKAISVVLLETLKHSQSSKVSSQQPQCKGQAYSVHQL